MSLNGILAELRAIDLYDAEEAKAAPCEVCGAAGVDFFDSNWLCEACGWRAIGKAMKEAGWK